MPELTRREALAGAAGGALAAGRPRQRLPPPGRACRSPGPASRRAWWPASPARASCCSGPDSARRRARVRLGARGGARPGLRQRDPPRHGAGPAPPATTPSGSRVRGSGAAARASSTGTASSPARLLARRPGAHGPPRRLGASRCGWPSSPARAGSPATTTPTPRWPNEDLDLAVCLGDYIYEKTDDVGPAHRHDRPRAQRLLPDARRVPPEVAHVPLGPGPAGDARGAQLRRHPRQPRAGERRPRPPRRRAPLRAARPSGSATAC